MGMGKSKEIRINLEQTCWSCGIAACLQRGWKEEAHPGLLELQTLQLQQEVALAPPSLCLGLGMGGGGVLLLSCFVFQSPLSCSGMGEGLKSFSKQCSVSSGDFRGFSGLGLFLL